MTVKCKRFFSLLDLRKESKWGYEVCLRLLFLNFEPVDKISRIFMEMMPLCITRISRFI
jgi:hypothetical protein